MNQSIHEIKICCPKLCHYGLPTVVPDGNRLADASESGAGFIANACPKCRSRAIRNTGMAVDDGGSFLARSLP